MNILGISKNFNKKYWWKKLIKIHKNLGKALKKIIEKIIMHILILLVKENNM